MFHRPLPPPELAEEWPMRFLPAPDVRDWILEAFVDPAGPLHNPDHEHLASAEIGVVWTNAYAGAQGRAATGQRLMVAGMAEMPQLKGRAWIRTRQEFQLEQWFGRIPDFVITLFAPAAADADDASFCALVEHEVYHCGQAVNEFGAPRFNRETGRPIFALRGHDVEEFVGVVRRWGAGASSPNVEELVRAAQQPPEIAAAALELACGVCGRRAA